MFKDLLYVTDIVLNELANKQYTYLLPENLSNKIL